jgi:hypothetical protein
MRDLVPELVLLVNYDVEKLQTRLDPNVERRVLDAYTAAWETRRLQADIVAQHSFPPWNVLAERVTRVSLPNERLPVSEHPNHTSTHCGVNSGKSTEWRGESKVYSGQAASHCCFFLTLVVPSSDSHQKLPDCHSSIYPAPPSLPEACALPLIPSADPKSPCVATTGHETDFRFLYAAF